MKRMSFLVGLAIGACTVIVVTAIISIIQIRHDTNMELAAIVAKYEALSAAASKLADTSDGSGPVAENNFNGFIEPFRFAFGVSQYVNDGIGFVWVRYGDVKKIHGNDVV